jgi:hypothetical protein
VKQNIFREGAGQDFADLPVGLIAALRGGLAKPGGAKMRVPE